MKFANIEIRNRDIIKSFYAGEKIREIAERVNLSIPQTHRVVREYLNENASEDAIQNIKDDVSNRFFAIYEKALAEGKYGDAEKALNSYYKIVGPRESNKVELDSNQSLTIVLAKD